MKKLLSIAAIAALATSSFAADDLASVVKESKVTGQIRGMYIKNDLSSTANNNGTPDSSAFAVGGKLGYETGAWHGISAGAVFYTSQDLGTKNSNPSKVDGSLYDENGKSYSLLGQAYLQGVFGKTTVKVGRQQIDTPLAGSDDMRMIPDLFEAALVINTDVPDTTLIGGYVSRMAGWDSISDKPSRTAFQSMSRSALGSTADVVGDNGVYVVAAINNSVKDLTVQAWGYKAVDVLNAVYTQADYKLGLGADTALNFGGQYYNIQNIGKTKDALAVSAATAEGKADYSVYGAKIGLETPIGLTPYVAYNKISEQKDGVNGGTFVFGKWGGVPEFTQTEELWSDGVNLNGASIWKAGLDYNLEKIGLGARTIGLAYTKFDVKDVYNSNVDNDKNILDVVYTCSGALVKNLDARIAYTRQDSKQDANDKDLLKVIFNYNF